MNKNDFLKNFVELFDDTDASEIQMDTKFKEINEWSSLIGMSLLAMTKERYGKILSNTNLRACSTIEDIYNQIVAE